MSRWGAVIVSFDSKRVGGVGGQHHARDNDIGSGGI
jgi:hypothetical protein